MLGTGRVEIFRVYRPNSDKIVTSQLFITITRHCGKLPHGGFASSDRGSAQALRSGKVWEAAVWGDTGLSFITLATWPAPANFRGFPPPGESRRSTPCAVRTPLCPVRYTGTERVQCVNSQTNY
jgi:hypothetical protein